MSEWEIQDALDNLRADLDAAREERREMLEQVKVLTDAADKFAERLYEYGDDDDAKLVEDLLPGVLKASRALGVRLPSDERRKKNANLQEVLDLFHEAFPMGVLIPMKGGPCPEVRVGPYETPGGVVWAVVKVDGRRQVMVLEGEPVRVDLSKIAGVA